MTSLFAALLAFGLGLALVPGARSAAGRCGLVAMPRKDRWHDHPTPLLGGAAIWLAVVVSVLALGCPSPVLGILGGGTLLFAFGFYDDLRGSGPASKVAVQLVAAAIAVGCGFRLHCFPLEALNVAASLFWIVSITNSVNLLDNMDGLAAGVVLIASTFLAWGLATQADDRAVLLPLALAGALGAFLFYNVHPASIFMGDSGSLPIGFTLASLSMASGPATSVFSFFALPVVTLLVPVLDTTLVTTTRFLSGRPITRGGRDHVSHRLVALGLPERRAVDLLWLLALVAGASAAVAARSSIWVGLCSLPLVVLAFALFGVFLAQPSLTSREESVLSALRAVLEFQTHATVRSTEGNSLTPYLEHT